jgi:hypothetical protein
VSDALPSLGLPLALHLFDRRGALVHRLHGLDREDCEQILAFSGKSEDGQPSSRLTQRDGRGQSRTLGILDADILFDLLDFVHHLRVPVLKWVSTSSTTQSHYGALDGIWRGPGYLRLRSDRCTFSCDLTFATAVCLCRNAAGDMQLEFRDVAGAVYAGFGQGSGHGERARSTWNGLLNNLTSASVRYN